MGTELLAVLIGLASAASWGAGDFLGGVASKKAGLYSVVITSQVVGLALIGLAAVLLREPLPPIEHWLGGALAGLLGVGGLLALYRALAVGKMGVAAPVSAVAAALVPVAVGLFTLHLPETGKLAGFGLALLSVWFVSRSGSDPLRRADLVLPLFAGLSFGLFYVIMSRVNTVSVLYPLLAARLASLSVLTAAASLQRQPRLVPRPLLGLTALCGALDAGGNAFFVLAAALGRLDVAAVLSSLYPAVTVLLAWAVLHERITRRQSLGVVGALVAVVLISA